MNPFDHLLEAKKKGEPRGMVSVCSAHPWVLKAALGGDRPVLIESTCNQVNQFGGYTGLTPAAFARSVREIAARNGFPAGAILLGGDHLGPSPWQRQPQAAAMAHACRLVQDCALAGYTKIHLDASMRLGDDPPGPLAAGTVARRTAQLARAAESAAPDPNCLRYVIGSEVPVPGGLAGGRAERHVTAVEDAAQALQAARDAFLSAGLEAAWQRVIALVVQPGVEFGDGFVLNYQPHAAAALARWIEPLPQVFEAHSTDYQPAASLRQMVGDHFAILKVGPALTFAFRQAVFALAKIEAELFSPGQCSHIEAALEAAMLRNPQHWQGYYHGPPRQQALGRKFSLCDRIRYYWGEPDVQAALDRLLANLAGGIPPTLLSQFFPGRQVDFSTSLAAQPAEDLLLGCVREVLDPYQIACAG